MRYPPRLVVELTDALLKGLGIENPTNKQRVAAESLIVRVILAAGDATDKVLSPKERLCLQLAACGFSAAETAKKLSLAEGTVKNYREKAREKLGCKTIAHAVYKVFCANKNTLNELLGQI